MKIVRSLAEVTTPFPHPIFAIGSFDGIHCGHQKVLGNVVLRARRHGGTAAVMTFHPHPQKIVSPHDSPLLIQTLEQKAAMLQALGFDLLLQVPFTEDLARLSAEQFVTEIIYEKLGICELHVGANFRFGHNRQGDVALLRGMGERLGIRVLEIAEVQLGRHKISSTRIRGLLAQGRVEFARRLLGRPFSVVGNVVHGAGLGSRIGVPTANLQVSNEVIPANGVYATLARIEGGDFPGVTNIGFRPTLQHRTDRPVVETHLLDVSRDLYGRELELFFHMRIREEQKFSGPEALVRRIGRDVARARRYFARIPARPVA